MLQRTADQDRADRTASRPTWKGAERAWPPFRGAGLAVGLGSGPNRGAPKPHSTARSPAGPSRQERWEAVRGGCAAYKVRALGRKESHPVPAPVTSHQPHAQHRRSGRLQCEGPVSRDLGAALCAVKMPLHGRNKSACERETRREEEGGRGRAFEAEGTGVPRPARPSWGGGRS